MLAAVTGASGHLGANLVRLLISRDWKVRALVHRDTRALDGIQVERVTGDILDEESLRLAFKGVNIVFHLAARISVAKWDAKHVEEINITGVQNVVNACAYTGVQRLVHTSSFHAHVQEPLDETLDESRPLITTGSSPPYNRSKAKGEQIVRTAISKGLDAVIITPSGMIGPYDFQPSHFGTALLAIAQGKLQALVDAGLDWVDTRDVAEGMIHASEQADSGKKYILSGHWASLQDIAQQVINFSGHSLPRMVLPIWIAKASAPFISTLDRIRGNRPLFTSISIKELESNKNLSHNTASKELGYEPRSLENTITDTLHWFQVNGFINAI
jgi:dihydroflavonol-4-reductase